MDKKIETILNELYLLDPTLKSHEVDLRALVAKLISVKPDASVDENFAKELRHKLLGDATKAHIQNAEFSSSAQHTVSWWVLRLAPLGAVAVLMLMLTAQPGGPSPDGGVFMTQVVTAENSLHITEQKPGKEVSVDFVTLKKGGFIAIHEDVDGSLGKSIGVSTILEIGRTTSVPITLSRVTKRGEILYAALYEDDGNRVFSDTSDKPVLDAISGAPMYMLFTISSDATTGGVSR